jgi:diadenosine tetraphosphate (Ap4A) HIT family hydrolase
MSVEGCFACRAAFETPVIRESTFWRTVINRNQNLLGKCMVVLKRHEEQVAQLTTEEWHELHHELDWLTNRLRDAFAPDHFNYSFLMNMDRHVHLHVIPRYVESRELAGVVFVDPEYPSAYRSRPAAGEISPSSVIVAVAGALSAELR